MSSKYPGAHLLGLPVEIREYIFDHLVHSSDKRLHLRDETRSVHLSTLHAPTLALLQTHPVLHDELLSHTYRVAIITLHVDAYAFARLPSPGAYTAALARNHYLQHAVRIDLRPTLNARVEELTEAVTLAVASLLQCQHLKSVTVSWAEAVPHTFHLGRWRPWPYKGPALRPLRLLTTRVADVRCGEVIMPPPPTTIKEQRGFERYVERVLSGNGEQGIGLGSELHGGQ